VTDDRANALSTVIKERPNSRLHPTARLRVAFGSLGMAAGEAYVRRTEQPPPLLRHMKIRQNMTCYACNAQATSAEHAPPRCFFPQGRSDLIQVPACPIHNQAKSNDDEYVACCIAMNTEGSAIATDLFQGPRLRAMSRREAKLGKRIFTTARSVMTLERNHTLAISYEVPRINRVIEYTARALYFHHTRHKWPTECTVVCPRLQRDSGAIELFQQSAQLSAGMEELRVRRDPNGQVYGAHPDVVWYQLAHVAPGVPLARIMFYGSFEFLVIGRAHPEEGA